MEEKEQMLFTDFPPVTTQEWEDKIIADLKGQDYERALIWQTYEGINVRPYYREEDILNLTYQEILPGEFPFIRGTKTDNNWQIRQDIFVNDLKQANKKALTVLGKGVTSLGFYFDCSRKITVVDLEILLKDICLEAAEINFVCGCENCNCAEAFTEYVISKNKLDKTQIIASSAIDPITSMILKGRLESGAFPELNCCPNSGLSEFMENILQTADHPLFRNWLFHWHRGQST